MLKKKRIDSLGSFMGRTLRNRHVSIIHRVQQSIISDLTRCQPMASTLPPLSFFSLHSTLPGSVFTAYAIHKFIKHERRCRGNFIEEGVGGGGRNRAGDDFPPIFSSHYTRVLFLLFLKYQWKPLRGTQNQT